MKRFVLFDPKPLWRGKAGHIDLTMHRAKIIMRDEASWLQDEIPGYVLRDRDAIVEIFPGDLIEFGRGGKPRCFASIEEYNGELPPIENLRQVLDKIDVQFFALCSREGLL